MPYHETPSKKAISTLRRMLLDSRVKLRHPFSIWYWLVETSQKTKGDIIQISCDLLECGVGWTLGSYLEDSMIEINLEGLYSKYDQNKMRFGREPPDNCVYTIVMIYNTMGKLLRKGPENKIVCTVEEILALANDYFPAWIPDDGKSSQLKSDWVKKALDMLVNVGLADKLDDQKSYEWIDPRHTKDYQGELTRRVAEFVTKGKGIVMPTKDGIESTKIDDFG
jgi:hypothetical protein